ncbi:MAG: protein kinase [Acidobacteriota bacterium]|nr:protein kinase [Acidobacteriota bacterium]
MRTGDYTALREKADKLSNAKARYAAVREIYLHASELSAAEQINFVRQACGEDTELRREVEKLLKLHDEAADFLETSALAAVQAAARRVTADDAIGMIVGNYRLMREIGRGGMGRVYLAARADDAFEQRVAVKFVRGDVDSDAVWRRFRRERQILADLEHPFIARLIDGGVTDRENLPYLVMEYVEGVPLDEYLRTNDLPLHARLDLFRQICQAVEYAHSRLIVHRDLKPSNILITKNGTPKLLDFGIAKILDTGNETGETRTGLFAFTPNYAAPEQIRGETLTTASDVYSLGVILYEMLTSTRPFSLENNNLSQIIQIVGEVQPTAPSDVSHRKAEKWKKGEEENQSFSTSPFLHFSFSQLKGDLDNIVLKALKKEPHRRYKSVEQFSEDVRRYLAGLPVLARPDTISYRAEKFFRRNRVAAIAATFVLLALCGGAAATLWQARTARFERDRAERRFNDVRQLANSFLFEINDEIERSPIRARELAVRRGVEYLDSLAVEAGSDLSLQSELAAGYERIGAVQGALFKSNLGDSGGALESYRKSLRLRQAIYDADPGNIAAGLQLAAGYRLVGEALMTTGSSAEAIENNRRAVSLIEELHRIAPQNAEVRLQLARSLGMLGQSILRVGDLNEVLSNYVRAHDIFKTLSAENPADVNRQQRLFVILTYLGYVRQQMGQQSEALRLYEEALRIAVRLRESNPNSIEARSNLSQIHWSVGVALRDLNRVDESLAHLKQALALQSAIVEQDPANIGERNALADCYLELGISLATDKQSVAALKAFEKAIAGYQTVVASDGRNASARRQINYARRHLADLLAADNRRDEAVRIYREIIAEMRELLSKDSQHAEWQADLAIALRQLAQLQRQKNEKESAANLQEALMIFRQLHHSSPANFLFKRDLEITENIVSAKR